MFSLFLVLLLVMGVKCDTKDSETAGEKLEDGIVAEPGAKTEKENLKGKIIPEEMSQDTLYMVANINGGGRTRESPERTTKPRKPTSMLSHIPTLAEPETQTHTDKRLFQKYRQMQLEAVKRIQMFGDYAKMYKLVDKMLKALFEVLSQAKVNVTEMGYLPGDPFPENVTVREAVALVLENTAMFGDLVLRLPDIVHAIYKKNNEWRLTISWAVWFCNESKIYDGAHKKLLHLMSQEIGLIPKEEGYINPYEAQSSKASVLKNTDDPVKRMKDIKDKKKIKGIKKGPRMTGVHTEL